MKLLQLAKINKQTFQSDTKHLPRTEAKSNPKSTTTTKLASLSPKAPQKVDINWWQSINSRYPQLHKDQNRRPINAIWTPIRKQREWAQDMNWVSVKFCAYILRTLSLMCFFLAAQRESSWDVHGLKMAGEITRNTTIHVPINLRSNMDLLFSARSQRERKTQNRLLFGEVGLGLHMAIYLMRMDCWAAGWWWHTPAQWGDAT
jgi:hypothetical protein